ncbi:hypothetical protein KIW84_031936 [Lathyrus oleraceus]|uniref:Uncharacterized protein n=1 Tax=Pisum sativum TaxID=3888 RepID=A0A9D5AY42_PEA|nr:hypothetical protein KIW84_031936 [Pisum sativum]
MAWLSWDKVCRDKSVGGIGIKNYELFNLAFLKKCHYRILNDKEAIWQDLLSFKYGDLKSQVNEDFSSKVNKKDSIWWRNLKRLGFDLLSGSNEWRDCFRGKLGNEES